MVRIRRVRLLLQVVPSGGRRLGANERPTCRPPEFLEGLPIADQCSLELRPGVCWSEQGWGPPCSSSR